MFDYDRQYFSSSVKFIAGLDEAGRGALAGPVFAALVVFGQDIYIDGLNDSKKLTEKKRCVLESIIKQKSLFYAVEYVPAEIIDKINILEATKLAMRNCVSSLKINIDLLLIDGNFKINSGIKEESIVGGDSRSASIAAASILAKVARDKYMCSLDEKYRNYGFKIHKGYGTKLHISNIDKYGATGIHRMTFRPLNRINY